MGLALKAVFGSGSSTVPAITQPKGDGVFLDRVGGPKNLNLEFTLPKRSIWNGATTNLDVITGGDGTSNTLLISERSGAGVEQLSLFLPAQRGVMPYGKRAPPTGH